MISGPASGVATVCSRRSGLQVQEPVDLPDARSRVSRWLSGSAADLSAQGVLDKVVTSHKGAPALGGKMRACDSLASTGSAQRPAEQASASVGGHVAGRPSCRRPARRCRGHRTAAWSYTGPRMSMQCRALASSATASPYRWGSPTSTARVSRASAAAEAGVDQHLRPVPYRGPVGACSPGCHEARNLAGCPGIAVLSRPM